MTLAESVPAKVRAELERQNVSYRELGRRLGKTISYVSRRLSEHPDVQFRMDELEDVAAALGVPVSQLLQADTETPARAS